MSALQENTAPEENQYENLIRSIQADFPGVAHSRQTGGAPMLEIDGRDFFLDV